MGVQFSMDTEVYLYLKSYAREQGVSMAAVLRTIVAEFRKDPKPVTSTADARCKTWFLVAYVWRDEGLVHTLRATMGNTAELPALAEHACAEASAPTEGVAEYVQGELARLRQNLARLQSSSLRVTNGPWLCQLDVYRERPEGS